MGETVVEVGEVRGLLRVDAGGIVLKCLAVLVTSNSAGLRLRSVLESVPNRVAPEKTQRLFLTCYINCPAKRSNYNNSSTRASVRIQSTV
jgi:hypothetical protein